MLLKLKTWEKSLIAPSLLLTISISQIHALVSYHHCLCFRADPCHLLPALLKALPCLFRFCTFHLSASSAFSTLKPESLFKPQTAVYDSLLSSPLMISQSSPDEIQTQRHDQMPFMALPTFSFSPLAAAFLSPRICHVISSLLGSSHSATTAWGSASDFLHASRLIQLKYHVISIK